MGWSGPGRQRHRAARMRVGHACGGGTSLPGWLEGACAFVRSARLRDRFVRFIGRSGPCLWGRRPGRGARVHAARRGRRHGSTPYASIADDSEVVRNRPIKCCDGFHSISHYLPAPAIRGDGARRDGLAIREILTGGAVRTHVGSAGGAGMQLRSRPSRTRVAIHPVTQIGVRRSVHGCEPLRTDHEPSSDRNGATGQNGGRTGVERNAKDVDAARTHSVARGGVAGKRGNAARRGNWPARRSGIRPRLVKPENVRRPGRRWRPGRPPGRISRRKPTPSTRRCAVRAPCRASGDQSQSRW